MSSDEDLIDAIVQVSFDVMSHLTQLAAANELSLTQLRVMAILRDREIRLSALAEHLGLDRSSISGLVERGESRGLVQRRPDPADGRASLLSLTRAGQRLAASVTTEAMARLIPMIAGLAPKERAAAHSAMTSMLAAR